MMRMSAKQIDHKPRVYLWDAEANEIELIYLPITKGVVSREHIEQTEQRDERIEAFVARLAGKDDDAAGLDFEENLRQAISVAKPNKRTEELIWQAVQG